MRYFLIYSVISVVKQLVQSIVSIDDFIEKEFESLRHLKCCMKSKESSHNNYLKINRPRNDGVGGCVQFYVYLLAYCEKYNIKFAGELYFEYDDLHDIDKETFYDFYFGCHSVLLQKHQLIQDYSTVYKFYTFNELDTNITSSLIVESSSNRSQSRVTTINRKNTLYGLSFRWTDLHSKLDVYLTKHFLHELRDSSSCGIDVILSKINFFSDEWSLRNMNLFYHPFDTNFKRDKLDHRFMTGAVNANASNSSRNIIRKKINIVAHIRHGDINKINHVNRWIPDEWFLSVFLNLRRLLKQYEISLHVFTSDYWEIVDNNDGFTMYVDHGIHVHTIDERISTTPEKTYDVMVTMSHCAKADIFLMSNSAFSSIAAFLNSNCVLFRSTALGKLSHWIQLPENISDATFDDIGLRHQLDRCLANQ